MTPHILGILRKDIIFHQELPIFANQFSAMTKILPNLPLSYLAPHLQK